MKNEKIIADELQCMFLEGKLNEVKEDYLNLVTRKLRTGDLTITELLKEDLILKEIVLEAIDCVLTPINDKARLER